MTTSTSRSARGSGGQLDSYHSQADGSPNLRHVCRDTGVERVLVSEGLRLFRGAGSEAARPVSGRGVRWTFFVRAGVYQRNIEDNVIGQLRRMGPGRLRLGGYQGRPWDWLQRK